MNNIENHLVFQVKDQMFSSQVECVNTILQMPKIYKVPQAPEYILGVINVDGEVIPVLDMGVRIKMGPIDVNEQSQVVILQYTNEEEKKTNKLGILVSEVKDVVEFDMFNMQELPTAKYHFDERLMRGMQKHENEFAMQLHIENFFREDLEELIQETIS